MPLNFQTVRSRGWCTRCGRRFDYLTNHLLHAHHRQYTKYIEDSKERLYYAERAMGMEKGRLVAAKEII